MNTAELTDGDLALFAPFASAKARGQDSSQQFDLFMRLEGATEWTLGCTCENRIMGWTLQNYLRRTWSNRVAVKLRKV